jgi:hypothetical protein
MCEEKVCDQGPLKAVACRILTANPSFRVLYLFCLPDPLMCIAESREKGSVVPECRE